jgi:hypothetical protein
MIRMEETGNGLKNREATLSGHPAIFDRRMADRAGMATMNSAPAKG